MLCRTQFDPAVYPVPSNVLNALLGMGWTDQSYRNDICPRFEQMARGWVLFVEAVRPEDRETGGWRFTVYQVTDDVAEDVLLECSDEGTLLDWLTTSPV